MLESEVESIERVLDELDLNVGGTSDDKSWKNAEEMITIGLEDTTFRRLHRYFGGEDTFTLKRMEYVVSRMILFGDYKYVENYIRTSSEARMFLDGVDETGNSALNLAACEKYPAIIKLLLDHEANADHQNKDGRSPLMEAALWGRIDNVKHLLEHGANRNLRDIHGRKASDFTAQSTRNEEERYQRSGGDVQVYREVTFIANQARRVIFELLREPEDTPRRGLPTNN